MTVPTNETLLVVDGHSLAFRAFFALPVDNFSTSSGQATNAVWGFATMLAQVIDAEKPDHLGVAFDVKGGTFRNEMLPQYKGTREAAPEELLTQLPLIQRMLTALGVTYIEKPGFEGDDVIATLATMGDKAGYHTLVLSGDRDAFQLVDDNVTVLYPGHHFKDLKHMTPQSIIDKYKDTGKKKLLLIHELTDETYSLVATTPVPDGVDKGWFYLFISMLDHVYWIIGCTFGALFGSLVNFNTKGVDFVMTALFIVIFTDQWLNSKNHIPAITGVICSVICLLLFGPDRFIIPAMLSILTILTLLRKPLEEHMEREDQKGDDSHA